MAIRDEKQCPNCQSLRVLRLGRMGSGMMLQGQTLKRYYYICADCGFSEVYFDHLKVDFDAIVENHDDAEWLNPTGQPPYR